MLGRSSSRSRTVSLPGSRVPFSWSFRWPARWDCSGLPPRQRGRCAGALPQLGPAALHYRPAGQPCLVVDREAPLAPLLAAAEHEALGLGHRWVGTEHLLLATLRQAAPSLCQVLQRHGVTYEG